MPSADAAPGSHAGSHTDERAYNPPDLLGQLGGSPSRSRTVLNEPGCLHRYLRIRRLDSQVAQAKVQELWLGSDPGMAPEL